MCYLCGHNHPKNPMKLMKRIRFLALLSSSFCLLSAHGQQATEHVSSLRDSTITVGYATGGGSSFTANVKKLDESQMNIKNQSNNALDAIRGRVAGMQVARNGANALSAVRLRGTTSLTGASDPLIIVDGVMGDLSLLYNVYPTDIESFTILKDASETSQYGSRGAAGVIEVNTLRGKPGKMRVVYNGSFGLQHVYKTLPMLSANQYREYGRQIGTLTSGTTPLIDLGADTDFQKLIQRTGFSQQYNIAFYGGTDQSSYRVSLGYVNNKSVIRNMGDRTFMSNMNMTQMLFDDLIRMDLGMFGSTGATEKIADEHNLFYSAAAWNPTFPDEPNSDGTWASYPSASQIVNPMADLGKKDDTEDAHISTHIKLTLNLLPELKLTLFGAYSYDMNLVSQYMPTTVWNKGQAYRSSIKSENLLGNAILSYNKTFGKHAIGLMGLAEVQEEKHRGFFTTVTNFTNDVTGYDNLAAGSLRPWGGTGSIYETPKMTSFMARANYTLLERYILALSVRADGSSKFGDNNRWGHFPSASAAWVLTNEPFMKNQHFFNYLKASVGYGLSGSQAGIDSYTTLALLNPSGFIPAGGGNVVSYSELKNINPDLKWEISKTFNFGIDAKMLDNRLLFSLNYYRTKVEDMIYSYKVSVPPFKYPEMVANLGSMRNSGLELSIGGTPLVTKDLGLTINGNITFQSNKLLALNGYHNGEYLTASQSIGIAKLNGAGFHGGDNDVTYQIVGQPLGSFKLPHCTGLIGSDATGYTYGTEDLDGNPLTVERQICGQAMPKVLIGTNFSVRYKNFDVCMQVNGAFGHKLFNGTSLTYMNVASFPLYNILEDAPRANIKDQAITDYWLESADYVNIDFITFGWRVPLRPSRYIESLRLSFTMDNVCTFTGYSGLTPMLNSSALNNTLGVDDKRSYPLYHAYSIAVNLSF